MKKSLTALAVLGAFAGSAFAADVSVYGVVDTGLMYTDTDATSWTGDKTKDSSFSMESGLNAASRFGLKATEDLGNGIKVGFKLENGLKSDSGEFKTAGKLFDREAALHVYTDYGTLSMGRMGGVGSSAGTYDIVAVTADAFDGGDNNVAGYYMTSRYDNVIAYQTPAFAGVQATAMYSFETDSANKLEGDSNAERYAGLAVTGSYGPANLVASYELIKRGNGEANDDQHLFNVGGNFDLQVTKLFALAQYTKGARSFGDFSEEDVFEGIVRTPTTDGVEAFGLHVGAVTPVLGGDLTTQVYYLDGELDAVHPYMTSNKETVDLAYFGLSARYAYPLSKRTTVYAGAGYAQTKAEANGAAADLEESLAQAYFGLTHAF